MEPSAHTRSTVQVADIPDVDLSAVGSHKFGSFEVEVVDYTAEYFATLKEVFDFPALRAFMTRSDFSFVFDALHAVTGAYAGPLFCDNLGAKPDSIRNGVPLEDFGGGHPDPNLTYAHDLVELMWADAAPVLGAASGERCARQGGGHADTRLAHVQNRSSVQLSPRVADLQQMLPSEPFVCPPFSPAPPSWCRRRRRPQHGAGIPLLCDPFRLRGYHRRQRAGIHPLLQGRPEGAARGGERRGRGSLPCRTAFVPLLGCCGCAPRSTPASINRCRAWRGRCPPAAPWTAWPRSWACSSLRPPPAGSSLAT
jgi:hypothetical protein